MFATRPLEIGERRGLDGLPRGEGEKAARELQPRVVASLGRGCGLCERLQGRDRGGVEGQGRPLDVQHQ
jgi:hypothetical protein